MINHVLMTRLKPDTTYNYIVGDGMNWSEERAFTTLPVRCEQGVGYLSFTRAICASAPSLCIDKLHGLRTR